MARIDSTTYAEANHPLTGEERVIGYLGPNTIRMSTAALAGLATVATRSALAGIDAADGDGRILTEGNRVGVFLFDSADLSTNVSADTQQGIYVAPTSDTTGDSGAWVRQYDGPINPLWFGIVEGDASGANGAGNSTALAAMFATMRTRASIIGNSLQGLGAVLFPPGYFEFGSTIDFTDGTMTFEGVARGQAAGQGTKFKFPAGVTGLRTQRSNTSGATTTDGVTHRGGDGTIIRGFQITGAFTSTEAEAHGIHLRSRALIENVAIDTFEGDGIYADVSAGGVSNEGNANNSVVRLCRITACRNGIYINGADANIWAVDDVDVSSNRRWGILDSSFLGNTYKACHAASNGVTTAATAVTPTVVSHGGQRYCVIAGEEAGASTNAPTGTTLDNQWWARTATGGVSSIFPAWLSGTTYRTGGSFHTDNNNAASVFLGCYHEGGQGLPQLVYPTIVVGGFLGGSKLLGTGAKLDNTFGVLSTVKGYRVEWTYADGETGEVTLGGWSDSEKTFFTVEESVEASQIWRWKMTGGNLRFDYDNLSANVAFEITGDTTTDQFGTGAIVPYAVYMPRLMVGASRSTARLISNGSVAPASGAHGLGEWTFNSQPSAGEALGWRCTVAGTPGTWEAQFAVTSLTVTTSGLTMNTARLLGRTTASTGAVEEISVGSSLTLSGGTLSASGAFGATAITTSGGITSSGSAIGYATGAGGAATQGTSRTTAVEINEPSGAITLFSAAGSTSWQTFTVTNSTVAATDTVIVNQKSGTDLNMIHVTAVAAGSFNISFATTGGTTVEQPVFNFALIKGASS